MGNICGIPEATPKLKLNPAGIAELLIQKALVLLPAWLSNNLY